ncbi:MAG TPA: hypothetical protein VFS10_21460 [Pyrinomonadaceae bacterium]|nr:hypothetical protein [Pyrinomonadaceae bacterium]
MHALSASQLLSVWERALASPHAERALALLALACPELSPQELARLSVGRRDSLLLTLREWTFGPRLSCRARCERCGEPLELSFEVSDIRAVQSAAEGADALTLSVDDYEVTFRLPNTQDLSAVAAEVGRGGEDLARARESLLARCVLRVLERGEERAASVAALPERVREALEGRMAEADPQSDVRLALSCPACEHRWSVAFDIVSYFWDEINAWAVRTLREVHTLASAYCWREEDILAMSPWRRHAYLEMVGG